MAKAIGWIVAGAFGVIFAGGIMYAVGETVDTIATYQ